MTQLMWLGEDQEDMPGPSYHIWNGVKFRKDQWVELTDAHMIAKAKGSRFYKVTEENPNVVLQENDALEQEERRKAYEAKQQVLRKQEAEQYDTSGARDVTPKQETQHAQGKALERKAQELKSKIETKKEDYNFRKTEKGSGYSPVKKKKEKAASRAGVSPPHTRPDSPDTDAA